MLKLFFALLPLVMVSWAHESLREESMNQGGAQKESQEVSMEALNNNELGKINYKINCIKAYFCGSAFVSFVVMPMMTCQLYGELNRFPTFFKGPIKKSYLGGISLVFGISTYSHYKLWESLKHKENSLGMRQELSSRGLQQE